MHGHPYIQSTPVLCDYAIAAKCQLLCQSVHIYLQVKKEWHEAEATPHFRMTGQIWSQLYLSGSDTDPIDLLSLHACYIKVSYITRLRRLKYYSLCFSGLQDGYNLSYA